MPRVSNIWPGHMACLTPSRSMCQAPSIVWPTPVGQLIHDPLGEFLGLFVGGADADALQVLGECALRLADAHAVVIEDDQHLPLEGAGAVEAFEGHAVDDGRVADDGDHVVVSLEVLIGRGPCRRRC